MGLSSCHVNVISFFFFLFFLGDFSLKFGKMEQGHFDCYPLLCCLLKALRFGSHCLYKLKAVLNAAPAQLMRGSLQNLHEMMLSNGWHKNVACNPPVQTLGVNMPAPPFSQRLLPVQTIPLPLPEKNTLTALRYSPPEFFAACDQWNNQEWLW